MKAKVHTWSTVTEDNYNYLHQGGNVFARLCLSVYLWLGKITQKLWTDLSEIFWQCRKWQKLQVV